MFSAKFSYPKQGELATNQQECLVNWETGSTRVQKVIYYILVFLNACKSFNRCFSAAQKASSFNWEISRYSSDSWEENLVVVASQFQIRQDWRKDNPAFCNSRTVMQPGAAQHI